MGEATVKYYDKDGKEAVPENAGTYTVKITVTEGANYAAVTELTADLLDVHRPAQSPRHRPWR